MAASLLRQRLFGKHLHPREARFLNTLHGLPQGMLYGLLHGWLNNWLTSLCDQS